MTKSWGEFIERLPDRAGVYAVWANGRLIYIGSTMFIMSRFKTHTMRKKFVEMGADRITYTLVPRAHHRECMERWLIRKHRPPLNRAIHPLRHQWDETAYANKRYPSGSGNETIH